MSEKETASSTLISRVTERLMSVPAEQRLKSRLVKTLNPDGTPVYFDPLLNGKMVMQSFDQSTGIGRASSKKGKDINDMKAGDLIDASIYGDFIQSVLSNRKVQEISVPVLRFSDSSKIYNASIIFKSRANATDAESNLLLVNQDAGKGVSSMRLNEAIANELVNDKMQGYFKMFNHHLSKFIDAPFGISQDDIISNRSEERRVGKEC